MHGQKSDSGLGWMGKAARATYPPPVVPLPPCPGRAHVRPVSMCLAQSFEAWPVGGANGQTRDSWSKRELPDSACVPPWLHQSFCVESWLHQSWNRYTLRYSRAWRLLPLAASSRVVRPGPRRQALSSPLTFEFWQCGFASYGRTRQVGRQVANLLWLSWVEEGRGETRVCLVWEMGWSNIFSLLTFSIWFLEWNELVLPNFIGWTHDSWCMVWLHKSNTP